jgi:hypothetical protein
VECCSGLSAGHCDYWPADRRRIGHLDRALKGYSGAGRRAPYAA